MQRIVQSKPIGTVIGSHEFDGDWIPSYYALPYVVGTTPRNRCEWSNCTAPATHIVGPRDPSQGTTEVCSRHVAPAGLDYKAMHVYFRIVPTSGPNHYAGHGDWQVFEPNPNNPVIPDGLF